MVVCSEHGHVSRQTPAPTRRVANGAPFYVHCLIFSRITSLSFIVSTLLHSESSLSRKIWSLGAARRGSEEHSTNQWPQVRLGMPSLEHSILSTSPAPTLIHSLVHPPSHSSTRSIKLLTAGIEAGRLEKTKNPVPSTQMFTFHIHFLSRRPEGSKLILQGFFFNASNAQASHDERARR